jgi:hypothetical protein
MSPSQSQAPRLNWLRRRKGCLIALFLPFLVVFILLSDLFLSPTGYRDASKESLATRKKNRESRLTPRKETSPENPVPSTSPSVPETSATAVSDDEARFWGDTRARLELRMEIFPRHFLASSFRKMARGEWTLDPTSNTPVLTSENPKALVEENNRLYLKKFQERLHQAMRQPSLTPSGLKEKYKQRKEIPCQTDAGLVQKGAWTVQEMDQLERFLLEKKWDREEGPDPVFLSVHWSPNLYGDSFSGQNAYWSRTVDGNLLGWGPSPVHELIYLILDRALESGDTGKTAQLIECYVRLSGEFCFAADPMDQTQVRMIETLERFLFWAASDPRVPEDVLEWVAATLASWKLTPQEAVDLRFANLERWHDLLFSFFSSLKPEIPAEPSLNTGPVLSFLNIALFRLPEKTYANATGPLLARALDRKTAALINRDMPEYQKTVLRQFVCSETPGNITTPSVFSKNRSDSLASCFRGTFGLCSTYLDLLAWDGTEIDEDGNYSGKGNGYIRGWNTCKKWVLGFTRFDWFFSKDGSSEHSSPSSPPKQTITAFERFGMPLDPDVDRFNDALAMARLVFAAARYHREYGHDPDSVEAMIPRYLDESFRPTPDRLWTLVRQEPQNTVVLKTPREQVIKEVDYGPWSSWYWDSQYSTSLTQVLTPYFKNPGTRDRWPGNPEDLRPYLKPGENPASYTPYFVRTGEALVFSLVFPNGLGKTLYFDPYRKAYEENRRHEKWDDWWIRKNYETDSKLETPPPTSQLTEDEKLQPDAPFQIFHILLSPWNLREGGKNQAPTSPNRGN